MPQRENPKAGDKQSILEQVFRGDHATIRHSQLSPNTGIPIGQPVFRKEWADKQARMVVLTLAPIEIVARTLDIAGSLQTGPVTGILTWGIEGGDAKEVEFDWGSAIYNGIGYPDGRGSGLQMCFPATYVQLDARNWMGSSPPLGGFPDPLSAVAVIPADAIVRAFMTVGAATQRRTPITRTFWDNQAAGGAGALVVVPAMAKQVRILRAPSVAITVDVFDTIGGPSVDQIAVPAGSQCPEITLSPDAIAVQYTYPGAAPDRVRTMFELAI